MATYQEQREREYQNKLVKRFQDELGYKYLGNWQYAKGETVNSLGKQNSPILDDEVRKFVGSALGALPHFCGRFPRACPRTVLTCLHVHGSPL